MNRTKTKAALITRGSHGIGRATALVPAAAGYRVFLLSDAAGYPAGQVIDVNGGGPGG